MGVRVLVYEENAELAEDLRSHIVPMGHQVELAQDPYHSLQLLYEWNPNIVVLGFDQWKDSMRALIERFRRISSMTSLPLIAITDSRKRLTGVTLIARTPWTGVHSRLQENLEQTSLSTQENQSFIPGSKRFEEIIGLLPDGVLELDSAYRIIYANASACKSLNETMDGISGRIFPDFFSPESRQICISRIQRVVQDQYTSPPEIMPFQDRPLRFIFTPARNSPEPGGVLVLIQDAAAEIAKIQDLHSQNLELKKLKKELERHLSTIQIIQKLPSRLAYPFGHLELVNAVLNFIPELVPAQAVGAILRSGEKIHVCLLQKENIGKKNCDAALSDLQARFEEASGQILNPDQIAFQLEESSPPEPAELLPLGSALVLPLREEKKLIGMIACFSTALSAFSHFDERLLELFLSLTFQSAVNMKEVIDAERKKIQTMVESMVDGVLMTDQKDEIVVMNQAARKVLRVSRREDHVNKKYFQDTLGFYPFRLTKGLVHRAGLQATIKEEIKVFDKTLHSVVSPVYDQDGVQTGTVVVLRDITEQKEIEERKNDFLSVISHELRTPLASIGGSLDLVLDQVVGQINEKQRRYLDLAKDSCQKLNIVIDDLLDLSKFEKGRMEIHMESISIVELVQEVAEKFQPAAIEKEIVIRLEKPGQDIRIYGDYNRLVQVMNNLMSNALKFTPQQGEIEMRVFTPKVMSPHVGVSVKDTGPGIRLEDLERVFDKFEQVRHSDSRKVSGTGLGLAISRGIIEAHKGKIWVESRPGEGAKFIFLLPAEKRSSVAPDVHAELAAPALQEDLNVVMIAADADSAYLLKGILLERGLKVSLSYNPQEGFSLIRNKIPQLIILDLDIDRASGVQLIDILCHDPETATVPIISLSREDPDQILPFANVLHIRKPLEINQFLHALATALLKVQGDEKRRRILLVDDDANLRMIAREALEFQNYVVLEAVDGPSALELLKQDKPDLIILDIMLPGMDGLQLAQIIKSNIATSHIPLVFVTARGQTEDKVKALKAGGNDYIVKPFDSTELAARIETILERTEKEIYTSPTTKLPGSVTIEKEINQLIQTQQRFALCYLDIDNLKAYNDAYGYAKADGVVRQTGDIIRETVLRLGHATDFVGHIAGDDFVFITQTDLVDLISLAMIEKFDQIIPYFYNQDDRQKGFIETEDRYGVLRKIPLLSISIVCLTNEEHQLADHLQIATIAADYKRIAKTIPGSVYIRDGKKISLETPSA